MASFLDTFSAAVMPAMDSCTCRVWVAMTTHNPYKMLLLIFYLITAHQLLRWWWHDNHLAWSKTSRAIPTKSVQWSSNDVNIIIQCNCLRGQLTTWTPAASHQDTWSCGTQLCVTTATTRSLFSTPHNSEATDSVLRQFLSNLALPYKFEGNQLNSSRDMCSW